MITYDELVALVGDHLGWGKDVTIYSEEQNAVLRDIIQIGYRKFLNPPLLPGDTKVHVWSFLCKWAELSIKPFADSGAITSGKSGDDVYVTRDDGAEWPAWSVLHGTFKVNDVEYALRELSDDNLYLYLETTTDPGWTSVVDWTLTHDEGYDLPDDFGGQCYGVFLASGSMNYEIDQISDMEIMRNLMMYTVRGVPRYCSLRPRALDDEETQQRYEIVLYPRPDTTYTVTLKYRINPPLLGAERDDGTIVDVPVGQESFVNALIESCMVAADEYVGVPPERAAAFTNAMRSAIMLDRQMTGPPFIRRTGTTWDEALRAGSIVVNGQKVW